MYLVLFQELADLYWTLTHVAAFGGELQVHLSEAIKMLIGRNLTYAFYYVTNYYLEIDFPDDSSQFRRRRHPKNIEWTSLYY